MPRQCAPGRPNGWRRLAPGARRPRRRDQAVFQVLEAIVIGFLIMSAVFFAVAFKAPPSPSASAGTNQMEAISWDALHTLQGQYYPDPAFANSTLSKAIADAMAGRPANLTEAIDALYPPGTVYNLYLNNGYDRMPVHVAREPTGQTVGASLPFEPRWNYVYTEPDLEVYDSAGTATTMGVTMIPLYYSNLVRDDGFLVNVTVDGLQSWLPGFGGAGSADQTYAQTAYTTIVQGDGTAPSAAIYMECDRDPTGGVAVKPCYAIDVTSSGTDRYDPEVDGRLVFVVDNDGPGQVASGAELRIDVPVGIAVSSANSDDFDTVTISGVAPNPQTIVATRTSPLAAGAEAKVRVWFNVTDDRYSFKTIEATLSGNAVSTSQLLVRAAETTPGTYTGGDARTVFISGPKPAAGASGPTRWGLVMPFPVGQGSVDRVTFKVEDASEIITSAVYPADFDPDPDVTAVPLQLIPGPGSGHTVEWFNAIAMPSNGFFELQLELQMDGTVTPVSPRVPLAEPWPVFDGYQPSPYALQIEPGVWWREEPPAKSGLDPLPGFGRGFLSSSGVNTTFEGRLDYRNGLPRGTTTYVLADLDQPTSSQGALKDALRAARLTVDDRTVGVGEVQGIRLNMHDLSSYLADSVGLGNVNLTTRVYAPWGVRDRIPAHTYYHDAAGGVLESPNDIEITYLNSDAWQDILIAYSDGNVYGIDGTTGYPLQGKSFAIPEAGNLANPVEPILLTKARDASNAVHYGVGTTAGTDNVYALDEDIRQDWTGAKAEAGIETLAINNTVDFNGDGVPEVIAAHVAATHPGPPGTDYTRLVLFDGATGAIMPGWEHNVPLDMGVTVVGQASRLAMGKVGPEAKDGIITNTGMAVGTSGGVTITYNVSEAMDPSSDPEEIVNLAVDPAVSAGVYKSGLRGYYDNGKIAWNMTGGRFVDVQVAPQLNTGGAWTGLIGGGGDGWVYGINGSKGITPVTGFEIATIEGWQSLEMANALEGYAASPSGFMAMTRDGWTTMDPYRHPVLDTWRAYVGVRAVDTVNAPYLASKGGDPKVGGGNVSWWVGDAGLMLRSTDHLATVDELSTVGQLSTLQSVNPTGATPTFVNLLPFDLTFVNFKAVYAVSADEAWFVGGGAAAPYEDDGFVVHATDGGTTLRVTRFVCADPLGILDDCHFNDIEFDGDRYWAVGNHGIALVNEGGGMAQDVALDLQPSDGVQTNGEVAVTVRADASVTIDKVHVDWTPSLTVEWMRSVQLNDTDLWNTSALAPYYVDSGAYSPTHGAGLDAVLDIDGYVTANGPANANTFTGLRELRLGPFKQTLDPVTGYYTSANFPTNLDLYVTVTFSDGTQDLYVLDLDGAGTHETSGGLWEYPDSTDLSQPFAVPNCFGAPTSGCGHLEGINVTRHAATGQLMGFAVGERIASGTYERGNLLRLTPGVPVWTEVDPDPVLSTLNDVAISTADPLRAIAVGDNDRVVATYDGGLQWTDLPKIYDIAAGPAAPLHAADYTHPKVGYVFGGGVDSLMWTVDGYAEWGRVITRDLYTGTGPFTTVAFNTSKLLVSEGGAATATVQIDIKDGANWVAIRNGGVGWVEGQMKDDDPGFVRYNFTNPSSTIELRITLSTPVSGFSRFSPQVRGTLPFHVGQTDDPFTSLTLAGTFDPTEASGTLFVTGPTTLVHDAQHGTLRLKAVQNKWVHKLGNPNLSWWDTSRDSAGARVGAMTLNHDGTIVYVGTESVYPLGSTVDTPPSDNDATLYALFVENGTRVKNWNYTRFVNRVAVTDPPHDPVRFVRAYDQGIYVVSEDVSAEAVNNGVSRPGLWRVDLGGVIEAEVKSVFNHDHTITALEVAYIDDAVHKWPVVGAAKSGDTGSVVVFEAISLLRHWITDPSMRGIYDFEFKVDEGAMFGGYIIETSVRWDITNSFKGTGSLFQTARIQNAFTVTPPNGRISASPTYTLEIVAWLEDWG